MKKGLHYWENYVPVVSWQLIRILLAMSALHNWHTVKIDFVLVFHQYPIEKDLYMDIPK